MFAMSTNLTCNLHNRNYTWQTKQRKVMEILYSKFQICHCLQFRIKNCHLFKNSTLLSPPRSGLSEKQLQNYREVDQINLKIWKGDGSCGMEAILLSLVRQKYKIWASKWITGPDNRLSDTVFVRFGQASRWKQANWHFSENQFHSPAHMGWNENREACPLVGIMELKKWLIQISPLRFASYITQYERWLAAISQCLTLYIALQMVGRIHFLNLKESSEHYTSVLQRNNVGGKGEEGGGGREKERIRDIIPIPHPGGGGGGDTRQEFG